MFLFLEGISPWWWVAFGVTLGAVEMATMTFFLIWPALAALCGAVLLWLWPGASGTAQVIVFALLSVLFTFAGRSLLNRYGDGGGAESGLNSRASKVVGREAEVLRASGSEGSVSIDGIHWRAVWPEGKSGEPGDRVTVLSAEGMTLHVE